MEVLIAFYENRLKDHYVITPPVLRGLKALVSVGLNDFSVSHMVLIFHENLRHPAYDELTAKVSKLVSAW